MVTLVELGYHDVREKDPYKFKYSYILSTIFTNLLAIELMRAYVLITKKKKLKEINSDDFNYEQKLLHEAWTADMKESERENGNTFMIRDRLRWSAFQFIIAGLQKLPVLQICLITVIDLIYVTIIYKENISKRTFASLGVKIKYVIQELSILTFLVVLSLFATIDTEGFKSSTIYAVLEIVVVVAVFLSIAAELFSVVWLVMMLVRNYLKERDQRKKEALEFKFEKAELVARVQIQDEPVVKEIMKR